MLLRVDAEKNDSLDVLSAREREVMQLIAEGNTNAAVAEKLQLSVRTVERHITNLYGKLDVRNRAEATLYALRHGLIGPPRR